MEELLERYRRWVFDLPASVQYHHARPHGLAEHSLEVGVGTLGELALRWTENACNRFVPAEQLPGLSRAAFVVGLLHDCGRLFDFEISLPDGTPWDPREESLVQFRSRGGIREGLPTPHRFLRGRTFQGHEPRGAGLIGRILGAQFSEDIDPEVVHDAYLAYVLRQDSRVWSLPTPLLYLGYLVQRADEMSVRDDRWKHREVRGQSGEEAMPRGSS